MSTPIFEETPEAIRFGSTSESARAVHAWVKQKEPNVQTRLEMQATSTKLLIFTSSGDFIVNYGEYLVYEEGVLQHYSPDAFVTRFGEGAVQELPEEPGGLEEEVPADGPAEDVPTEA